MNHGQTVFAQLINHLSHDDFRGCVNRYDGNRGVRSFSCWNQFLAMAFAQLTFRESLREIEDSLGALQSKLYHMGFHSAVKRSTLADANETRDWRIFADFAHSLIRIARPLYEDSPLDIDFGADLQARLYALDATVIDLCLTLFPWAQFRRAKSAVKLHTFAGSSHKYPGIYRYYRRQPTRSKHFRWAGTTAGFLLSDGPCLRRFSTSLSLAPTGYLLFHSRQRQSSLQPALLTFSRQIHGPALRSKYLSHRSQISPTLSRSLTTRPLLCRRERPALPLPDKQLPALAPQRSGYLPTSLDHRIILQVDQTESQNQSLLWHFTQQREDTNLDCRHRLRASSHRQKAVGFAAQLLPNFTNFEFDTFRESAHFKPLSRRSGPT